ncbi:type I secretion system permease/ATPase [Thiomicrorhabdus sp. 6S2-11]|uniref:Type I secretion system permease/ATPase n=1 Tax=Thiomicrorhabdus marina TaxID=2818442 RepID=A0ABS3Q795_9GAMM|nr:type I secretion system permease/ATPase [Thiomicrorhabdus marina]MBO1928235.1 type I secretion system permease/ATPase [Thiomicrorhabdus marina]
MTNSPTQHDPLSSCLLHLCQIHERSISRESLLNGLPLENGTLIPSVFERAAKRAGLSSKVQNRQLQQINPHLLPCVLLLKNQKTGENDACLLYAINDTHAVVGFSDIPESSQSIDLDDLAKQYQGQVIYVRPEFLYQNPSLKIEKPSLHWFWGVIQENRGLYKDILIASILINLFAVAMPMFVMNVYDRVVPNHTTDTLWILAAGIFLVITTEIILKLMRSWFVDLAANRADVKLSSTIMERVLNMRLVNRPHSSGSFISNVQSFESIRSFIGSLTVTALVDLPFVLLFTAIITLINPILVIPIVLAILIVLAYALSAQQKMHELSIDSMEASAKRNDTLYEAVANIETLKGFNAESRAQSRWEKSTLFITRNAAKMRFLSASISNGATWIQHMAAVSVIILGVYLIIEGEISQGALIAAYLLTSRAMGPVSQTAGLLAQYHYAATSYQALEEIMQRDVERPQGKSWVHQGQIRGDIEFRNVEFSYPNDERSALSNVSFKIKQGERVAILGRNGSGKTTVEKLLLGLFEPKNGSILVDGIDLRQIDPAELRRNIGYIPQDIVLFNGTLKENLMFGAPLASDEQIVSASNISGLAPIINAHPEGFNMQVGERGQALSGGQKQSVALARSIINDPPVLLFDEPTGSLDFSAEAAFSKNLKRIVEGKTLITITHRTSLLNLVERIIVLDKGRVIADGPKDQVMEALRQGQVGRAQ